jgi:hypothetical protein
VLRMEPSHSLGRLPWRTVPFARRPRGPARGRAELQPRRLRSPEFESAHFPTAVVEPVLRGTPRSPGGLLGVTGSGRERRQLWVPEGLEWPELVAAGSAL